MSYVLGGLFGFVAFAVLLFAVELLRSQKPTVHRRCGMTLRSDATGDRDLIQCTRRRDHDGVHAGKSGNNDVWWQKEKT